MKEQITIKFIGKQGSGKSRVLKKVKELLENDLEVVVLQVFDGQPKFNTTRRESHELWIKFKELN